MPAATTPDASDTQAWLLLLPQLGSAQSSLRVRLWRRLKLLGAVPLGAGAQALPDLPACRSALRWLVQELSEAGAEASLVRAEPLAGVDGAELRRRFDAERADEYRQLIERARSGRIASDKLARELERIEARDHFGHPLRASARAAIAGQGGKANAQADLPPPGSLWVTRPDVHVDRLCSAWLIRRVIDPGARFAFDHEVRQRPGVVHYDMVGAEFTHRDQRCTFEVLLDTSAADDPALRKLAQMVHDLDLKDARYAHPETAGLRAALLGVRASSSDDLARIDHAGLLLDSLRRGLA